MASTFRLGSSIGPCHTPAAERAQVPEQFADKGNTDPDKLLQCPFDKNHQIRACRFPYHLIKCRKNHPKLASQLRTCPFNAGHLLPKHEMAYHAETCEDRITVEAVEQESERTRIPISSWVNPDMTEDWDEEADDNAPPFVWGVNMHLNQIQKMRPTNGLDSSLRAPDSLPWSRSK